MEAFDLSGLLTSLKTATEILKNVHTNKQTKELRESVQNLQSALIDTQTEAIAVLSHMTELRTENDRLRARLKAIEDWNSQENRYLMVCPWKNSGQVYALKKIEASGEPPHYLCTNCFHQRRKSILNPVVQRGSGSFIALVCPLCKSSLDTGYRGIDNPVYAEDIKERDT